MKDLLKKLADAHGVSGFEDEVRNIMIDELRDYVDDVVVDEMGNVIATRNGKPDGKRIMLAAHMDEIGLWYGISIKMDHQTFREIGGINDLIF